MTEATPRTVREWTGTTVTITAPEGLHARPVIKLSRLARRFASSIQVGLTGQEHWVDGKSVARLMALRAERGQSLALRAMGADADAALAALVALVERDFVEEGGAGA
jgi:phosphocarrier protein